MKGAVSSVDLYALVHEMQFLVGSKLQKVYHPSRELFFFEFHCPGKGKQILRVIPGKLVNLGSEKQSVVKPSGLSMYLRKYLTGGRLVKIWQKGTERILVLDFEVKNADEIKVFHVIIELFSKGNLIFCSSDWIVMNLLGRQLRETGAVTHKKKYEFPPEKLDWAKLVFKDFKEILLTSDRKNLATTIAVEIGVGGLYAEEICARAEVDGKILSATLTVAKIKKIFSEFEKLLKSLKSAKGYKYGKEVVPVKLVQEKYGELETSFEYFYLALVSVNPLVKESPYEKKIANVLRIIERQEKAVDDIEEGISKATAKGEKIYSEYSKISKLIEHCNVVASDKGWAELSKELKGLKSIKQVDLKKKILTVEL